MTPLCSAYELAPVEVANALLDAGADIDPRRQPEPTTSRDVRRLCMRWVGTTPMWSSCS